MLQQFKVAFRVGASGALPVLGQLLEGYFSVIDVAADFADPLFLGHGCRSRLFTGSYAAVLKLFEGLHGFRLHILLVVTVDKGLALAKPGIGYLAEEGSVSRQLLRIGNLAAEIGNSFFKDRQAINYLMRYICPLFGISAGLKTEITDNEGVYISS